MALLKRATDAVRSIDWIKVAEGVLILVIAHLLT